MLANRQPQQFLIPLVQFEVATNWFDYFIYAMSSRDHAYVMHMYSYTDKRAHLSIAHQQQSAIARVHKINRRR